MTALLKRIGAISGISGKPFQPPLANAILMYADNMGASLSEPTDFEVFKGKVSVLPSTIKSADR